MFQRLIIVIVVIVIILAGGFAFLATWEIPAPAARIEKVIPNDRFTK